MSMAALAELRVGVIEDAEMPQVLALANAVQPHAPWTAEHFAWQFHAPPAGKARLFVVRADDSVAGLYCAVRARLDRHGETVEACRVQDVMTHPRWRGRGVLHALAVACRDWLRVNGMAGYAFPNEHSHGSFVRTGWDVAGAVPWWRGSASATGVAVHAVSCDAYDERATEIWDAARIGVAIRRDAAYLNWRYARPGQTYRKFIVDGETILVLKEYGTTVHVCDVFAPANARHAITRAVRFARHWAATRGAESVTVWLPPGHRDAPQLEAAGLVSQPDAKRFVVTWPAHDGARADSLYVSHSDNDIF